MKTFWLLIIGIIIGFIIFNLLSGHTHMVGEVVNNYSDCQTGKSPICTLDVKDEEGLYYQIDYAGGSSFCPLFGQSNSGFKGKVDPNIFTSKKGDKIEVYGHKWSDGGVNRITTCWGAPIFYIKKLN